MLLVGFGLDDTIENVKKMALKVANLRIFPDSEDKLNLSIKDVGGSILSISQYACNNNLNYFMCYRRTRQPLKFSLSYYELLCLEYKKLSTKRILRRTGEMGR